MTGRRVALLCIDPWEETGEFHPFNYAVRRVQASLRAHDIEAHLVESNSTAVEPFLERIAEIDPDVVGMSAYVWSFATFLEIARRLKERRPDIVIVIGGPSARTAMFDLPPYRAERRYFDALVTGEGELAFLQIVTLAATTPDALCQIPSVVVPTSNGWRHGPPTQSITDLNALSSPYALDLVPRGVSAHLETFRGCPLACTFCQWGDADRTNRVFSAEVIARDLEHYRRLGLRDAVLVDAGLNLNIRAFRELVAAERQAKVLREVALSYEVYPSHLKDEHLEFLSEIRSNSIGLGLQSYDPEVLRRMQRSFDPHRFEQVIRDLASFDGHVTIEIIMGLPGDNPESFRRTLARAREQACDVRVFHCLVLPDALMTRAPAWAAMDFDPVSLRMRSCSGWTERDMAEMREELSHIATDSDGWDQGSFWLIAPDHRRGHAGPNAPKASGQAKPASPEPRPVEVVTASARDEDFIASANTAIQQATKEHWKVREATRKAGRVTLTLDAWGVDLVVDLASATPDAPSFVVYGGVGVAYRGQSKSLTDEHLRMLRAIVPALAALYRSAMKLEGLPPQRHSLPVLPP